LIGKLDQADSRNRGIEAGRLNAEIFALSATAEQAGKKRSAADETNAKMTKILKYRGKVIRVVKAQSYSYPSG
jgi:hypothetical protein